jgi:peptidoglycan/xylan/chitin deacetylase (PgdA/CDA1 family)
MRYRWPDNNECAVVLSFDFDAESAYHFREPKKARKRLDGLEERRYGPRTGVPRILRLLERYQLPATFFTPGFTIEHHTEAAKSVRDAGFVEMACHGNVHESVEELSEDEERQVLKDQLDIYEKYLGLRPTGYRSPSWSMNNRTPALLKEHGFTYDSSLMGDDVPYFLDTPYGRLTEVPVHWMLDDAPYYRHVYGSTNGIADPDRVIRLWAQEFHALRRENGCFMLTMHPWISGHAGRLDGLEQLVQEMKSVSGVWFATTLQVADWAAETGQNAGITVAIPEDTVKAT